MDGVDGGVMTTPNKKREVAVMGGDKKMSPMKPGKCWLHRTYLFI